MTAIQRVHIIISKIHVHVNLILQLKYLTTSKTKKLAPFFSSNSTTSHRPPLAASIKAVSPPYNNKIRIDVAIAPKTKK